MLRLDWNKVGGAFYVRWKHLGRFQDELDNTMERVLKSHRDYKATHKPRVSSKKGPKSQHLLSPKAKDQFGQDKRERERGLALKLSTVSRSRGVSDIWETMESVLELRCDQRAVRFNAGP